MTAYRVGQVLYVIPKGETRIYPVQIVEEVTKKTLEEGAVTSYMVRGSTQTEETLDIDSLDGEVFDSAAKLQKTLVERATAGITAVIESAVAKAHEWYPTGFEQPGDDELASLKKAPVPGQPPLPPTKQQQQQRPQPKKRQGPPPEVAMLAAELAAETEQLEVELPDGTRAKVGSIKVPESLQG